MVDGVSETALLRWIPLLPLLAAAVHGLMLAVLRRSASRQVVIALSCGSVIAAFLLSLLATVRLLGLPSGNKALVDNLYTWISAGSFYAEAAFRFDSLSAVMCLVVTGVGSLIHVYSIGYMDDDHREDKGFQRFFCYLNLFTFSMLVLVLGDNLLLLFVGWEGVGLCSYLLIGFWYSDRWNAYCGSKAFIVNRIGDFGFLVGILLIFWTLADAGVPSISFADIAEHFEHIAARTVSVPAWLPGPEEWRLATLIGLCLFIGACGKSAQLPLYVWLPDAMAGPTPVSALIHAATMVTAGVYLVCRMGFLYAEAPGASAVVAWTGAVTALFAATIAVTQTDIKKVLAYSTVSQLGYMFLAAGCGGYSAAIFHLGTHAFFKALLFLGAGAVILALHHEQDLRKMGGLRWFIPKTHIAFLFGVLAIIGTPFFSGFFSKDEILVAAWSAALPGHGVLYAIGLLTAGLTAFYMLRLYLLTFSGKSRVPEDLRSHVHEPAQTVLVPLYVLAFLSLVGGVFGLPQVWGDLIGIEHSNSLARFLAPLLPEAEAHALSHAAEYGLAALAVAVAAAGAALAWCFYALQPEWPEKLAHSLRGVYRVLVNKYYVDEIYDAAVVKPLVVLSDRVLFRAIDTSVIDRGAVGGSARAVVLFATQVLRRLHGGLTQSYLFLIAVGTFAIAAYWLR